jgi:hypothetical protein
MSAPHSMTRPETGCNVRMSKELVGLDDSPYPANSAIAWTAARAGKPGIGRSVGKNRSRSLGVVDDWMLRDLVV